MKSDKIVYIAVLALLQWLLLAGCVEDQLVPGGGVLPPVTDGKVRLEVFTNAEDYPAPTTRAGNADENTIGGKPWVFVFRGTDDEAVFAEAVQAFVVGSKSYVTLTESSQTSVLILVANAPDTFFDGTDDQPFDNAHLAAYFAGRPALGDAMNNLYTTRLATPKQTTVPYAATSAPYPTLPMTGRYDVPSINETTSIGTAANKVILTRIVAKVTVEYQNNIPGFGLIAATVMNAPRNGRLYQSSGSPKNNAGNQTNYLTDSATDPVDGIAPASGSSTAKNPIYMYEIRKEEKASLIFKATYYSTNYYYRITFMDENGLIDVLRNKHYRVIITSVTGPGYTTLEEARYGTPQNFHYRIEVTDQVSTDVIDNGLFYLGVSNSEYYVYEDAAISGNRVAVTITTNATADMDIGSNSITGTIGNDEILPVLPSTVNLAPSAGETGTTEVTFTLPPYTTLNTVGNINIKLGNLTKSIRFVRSRSMTPLAYPILFTNYSLTGTVTGGEGWLRVSADNMSPGATSLTLTTPGPIYLTATPNVVESGGAIRTGGEAYLTTTESSQGRIKVSVSQNYAVIGQTNTIPQPYVGTFHRWNQTGERLIRIPTTSGMDGSWTAQVVKGDFIVLDPASTSDPGVTYNVDNESPADMNLPANDARYQVNSTNTLVRGHISIPGDNIYINFRVGLTGTLPGGADGTPRYGVIALAFNHNTKYTYIYVRQGEQADYVMRPNDPVNSGGMTSATRPLARRFSPYNLTDPQKGIGIVNRGTRGYVFTDYPSQAGYFFQWGDTRAWYPTDKPVSWSTAEYTSYWSYNPSWETCPKGYHRPNDGSVSSSVYAVSVQTADSELRQSLFFTPTAGYYQSGTNVVSGNYADGYFDRRALVNSQSNTANTVAGSGANIAYTGKLFFNPTTKASVFFPNAGNRSTSGSLTEAGTSVGIFSASGSLPSVTYGSFRNNGMSFSTGMGTMGMSLRCVADQ